MQFLLTEEEYKDLVQKKEFSFKQSKAKVQKVCTEIADNMIVTKGWAAGRVWGCVLSTDNEHYCDECPVREICPCDHKHWSQ